MPAGPCNMSAQARLRKCCYSDQAEFCTVRSDIARGRDFELIEFCSLGINLSYQSWSNALVSVNYLFQERHSLKITPLRFDPCAYCTCKSIVRYNGELAGWHPDRWLQAQLPCPSRVTSVIERQQLAARLARSKMQRVGKVDSIATMA